MGMAWSEVSRVPLGFGARNEAPAGRGSGLLDVFRGLVLSTPPGLASG